MNPETGERLESLIEHIRLSIEKIVTTPIGSRVMRRDYGSLVPELIDAPINGRVRLLVMAAVAAAVVKWEPRVRIARVLLAVKDAPASGLAIELTAAIRDRGSVVRVRVSGIGGRAS